MKMIRIFLAHAGSTALAALACAATGLALASVMPTGMAEIHAGRGEVTVYLDTSSKIYGAYIGEWGLEWTHDEGPGYFRCSDIDPINCPYLDPTNNNE